MKYNKDTYRIINIKINIQKTEQIHKQKYNQIIKWTNIPLHITTITHLGTDKSAFHHHRMNIRRHNHEGLDGVYWLENNGHF